MTPEIDSYCIFHILFGHLLGHCLLPSTTPEVHLLPCLRYCPAAVAKRILQWQCHKTSDVSGRYRRPPFVFGTLY